MSSDQRSLLKTDEVDGHIQESDIEGSDDSPAVLKCAKLDFVGPDVKCNVCQKNVHDPEVYGDFYHFEGLTCHYFCLLFSSSLVQNGEDHEGILGFFPKDIRKEISRGYRLKCAYCRTKGATIGCSIKACKKTFHFPCGIKNGSMHQFYENFLSFCSAHRPTQKIARNVLKGAKAEEDLSFCPICYDKVFTGVSNDTLWAPCCKKRWFHRCCVQKQALAQGYFFRCPLCNNKEIFKREMKEFGIFIPDADAAWEREPHAFEELLETYRHCDADDCKCPNGRNTSQNVGSWRLLKCNACGSQGTHIACSGLKMTAATNSWRCPLCAGTLSKANQQLPTEACSQPTRSSPNDLSDTPSCSVSVASSSFTSQRRPANMAFSPVTQVNKRRKSSTQSVSGETSHVHFEHANSSTLESNLNQPTATENYYASQMFAELPCSSKEKDSEEDEIIVVDSDDDLQIIHESTANQTDQSKQSIVHSSAPSTQSECVDRELLTKEGMKIKVHKVTAKEDQPVRVDELQTVKMYPSTSTYKNPENTGLQIQIENVRHTTEYFSSPQTENYHPDPGPSIPSISLPSVSLFGNQGLPEMNYPQVLYYPVKTPDFLNTCTPDGRDAIQAMMPVPTFCQYQNQQQILGGSQSLNSLGVHLQSVPERHNQQQELKGGSQAIPEITLD